LPPNVGSRFILSSQSHAHRRRLPAGDGWVIRNLAYEMKVGPVEGRPAMIVMRPADAELSLPAGRYALVLKGSAYDFTVDGPVTDLAQCIERSDEVDAPVYTPCHSRP
jgi:hypothetical protein